MLFIAASCGFTAIAWLSCIYLLVSCFIFILVFTVRRYVLHGLSYRNSVRPSVRLSHSCTVSKWFNLRSWFLHHMVAPSGSIPKRPMNQNGPRKRQKRPIARYQTAHVDVQNGPQLDPKRPTRMSKMAHRPKRPINFRYIQNGLLTEKSGTLR